MSSFLASLTGSPSRELAPPEPPTDLTDDEDDAGDEEETLDGLKANIQQLLDLCAE